MHRSKLFHLLVVMGAPGWAKTYTTRRALRDLGVDYRMLGSYSTPLALYNHLCESPDRLLLIDDTAGLFHNSQAMSILNAACWAGGGSDGARTVSWSSTTDKALLPSVNFAGKMIVLTNFMPETPQGKAFVNRSLIYRIQLDEDLIGELLLEAAKSTEHFPDRAVALEVAQFLRDHFHYFDSNRISLRTLEMGVELATLDPEGWRDLLLRTMPPIAQEDVVRSLDKSGMRVARQAEEFRRLTGKSRRTFFYVRSKLGLGDQTEDTIERGESSDAKLIPFVRPAPPGEATNRASVELCYEGLDQ